MKTALIVVLAVLATLTLAKKPKFHELDGYTFDQYRADFKKPYGPEHEGFEMRKATFNKNLQRIKDINANPARTWNAGVNMFTDMTDAEFKRFNGYKKSTAEEVKQFVKKVHEAPSADEAVKLPKTVDWREANPRVLTAVKHQGSCGSCWAHSAAESIEAQYALLTGMLPVLSVAQINSCTPNSYPYFCAGCNGGDYMSAWSYLANQSIQRPEIQKSVTENWAYPIPLSDWFYSDQPAGTPTTACRDVSKEWKKPATSWFAELTAAGVSGSGLVNSNTPTGGPAAMKALRDIGPQSVSVAAGNWQWYESGVFTNTAANGNSSEWEVDHAVQMVGYGYDKVLDMNYWVVRNSWSTLWGEDGFIRLARAKDGEKEPCNSEFGTVCGTSGVLSEVAYPIVFEATPTKFG